MNRETGEIVSEEEAAVMNLKFPGLYIPMTIAPTARQQHNRKVGRNDPCPCGSGKKFKKCCLLTVGTKR